MVYLIFYLHVVMKFLDSIHAEINIFCCTQNRVPFFFVFRIQKQIEFSLKKVYGRGTDIMNDCKKLFLCFTYAERILQKEKRLVHVCTIVYKTT